MLRKGGPYRFWPEKKYGRVLLVTLRTILHGGFHPRRTWLIFRVVTSLQVTNIFVAADIMIPRDLLLDEIVSPCPRLGPMERYTFSTVLTMCVRCADCCGRFGYLHCALVLLFSKGHEEGLCWQYTLILHALLSGEL